MPPPPPPPNKPSPSWPIPKFTLRVEDLEHPGAALFFEHIIAAKALRDAVITVFNWLYTPETVPTNVEHVLLVVRPMDGVAYTHGTATHKEIHLSSKHIVNSSQRARDEILGVLTHEMVHCFQYNGEGKCPGGMIEGVADWVRLHASLSPPHWKREAGDKWDAGYQTTAYFLDWIEERYGQGTVRELNDAMKDKEYTDDIFQTATGRKVGKLWKMYCAHLEDREGL